MPLCQECEGMVLLPGALIVVRCAEGKNCFGNGILARRENIFCFACFEAKRICEFCGEPLSNGKQPEKE